MDFVFVFYIVFLRVYSRFLTLLFGIINFVPLRIYLQYPFSVRDLITGLTAPSPFDSPFSPPDHLYLLPSSSLLYLPL